METNTLKTGIRGLKLHVQIHYQYSTVATSRMQWL